MRNLIHRARTVKSIQSNEIFKAVRFCLPQLFAHAVGFKLKDGAGVAGLKKFQGFLIVNRNTLKFKVFPRMEPVNVLNGFSENRQRRKSQEVELHEAHVFDVFFVVLTHRVFRTAVCVIKRTEVREFSGSDQDAPRMHAEVARDAFEFLGVTHELLVLGLRCKRRKVRFHLRGFLKRHIKPRLLRNEFGEAVHLVITHVQNAAYVTHNSLGAHSAESDDLAYGVRPVDALHVLNRAVTVMLTEVHVKVRHRDALRIQEAFEQQPVMQGIEVRNTEAIRDKRSCARTTARPHRHTVTFGPVDEVLHDEEVPGELHRDDGLKFVIQTLHVFRAFGVTDLLVRIEKREALFQPFLGELDHVVIKTHAVRRRKDGELGFLQHTVQVTALRNHHGVFKGLRDVGKEFPHLLFGLEILLRGVLPRPFGVCQNVALRNTHPHFVRGEVLFFQKLNRMSGYKRQLLRDRVACHLRNERIVAFAARSLHFQVKPPGESLL